MEAATKGPLSEVHRPLSLVTPNLTGPDIKATQEALNAFFKKVELPRRVEEDGELGTFTKAAMNRDLYLLGVSPAGEGPAGPLFTQAEQHIIRSGGDGLSAKQKDRSKRRIEEALRATHAAPGGADKAVEWMLSKKGTTEIPPGSNWGPPGSVVRTVIEFCGMGEGTYWCGCFQSYAAIKIGGALVRFPTVLTHNTQMLTYADAGGYGVERVSVANAQRGDITSYNFAHIGGLVEKITGSGLHTIEGNTSPEGQANNGGGVYEHTGATRNTSMLLGIVRPNYGKEKVIN